uniref:Ligand dependent nuclear receptor corepressor n=1 Tax=Pelodiscus sinensis TaxID=13735 RepID=K7FPQ1_PELSI
CLQIRLLKRPGAKRFRREVQLHGAASVCFPQGSFHKALLRNIQAPGCSKRALGRGPKQRGRGEGGMTTRQTYRSRLSNEGAVAREGPSREGSPTTGGPSQSGEKLEICVEANSDKRSVLLPRDSGAGVQGAEQSARKAGDGDAPADTAVDTGQVQQQDLSSSPPGARGKSGSKAPPAKSWKHKSLALPVYNLRHSPAPLEAAKKSPEALQVTPSQQEEASSGHPDPLGWKEVDPPAEDRPKFVEWCAEEETQELIADFNAQYARVQRGWIQLEREAQPAPKAKNKADKLKEIWKSKKRTRKCRASLEAQKLSPVQMLFLKAFKLSNVCRWFLETTETRSLVIVKKLNTRLPGDVPPIKIPLQKFCSAGLYPSSLQAERLKKHLKKFAAATPAKNNLKNQKLWARLREGADRAEPDGGRGGGAGELSSVESKPSRKSVCINPLMSPKLALQVKADVFPAKPAPAEAAAKGRKGKSRPQEGAPPKAAPRPGRKRTLRESSGVPGPSPSSSRDRPPAPQGSK